MNLIKYQHHFLPTLCVHNHFRELELMSSFKITVKNDQFYCLNNNRLTISIIIPIFLYFLKLLIFAHYYEKFQAYTVREVGR